MARTSRAEEIALARTAEGRERRKQRRLQCAGSADVAVPTSGFLCHGRVQDISLTGCYITTRAPLDMAIRTCVELSLCVNGDSFTTPARLIIERPNSGAAFEFLPIAPEMRTAHLAVMRKLTAELPPQEARAAG